MMDVATTDGAGVAQFSTGRVVESGDTVEISVFNVAASGFVYEAASNIETSDQITVGP